MEFIVIPVQGSNSGTKLPNNAIFAGKEPSFISKKANALVNLKRLIYLITLNVSHAILLSTLIRPCLNASTAKKESNLILLLKGVNVLKQSLSKLTNSVSFATFLNTSIIREKLVCLVRKTFFIILHLRNVKDALSKDPYLSKNHAVHVQITSTLISQSKAVKNVVGVAITILRSMSVIVLNLLLFTLAVIVSNVFCLSISIFRNGNA